MTLSISHSKSTDRLIKIWTLTLYPFDGLSITPKIETSIKKKKRKKKRKKKDNMWRYGEVYKKKG